MSSIHKCGVQENIFDQIAQEKKCDPYKWIETNYLDAMELRFDTIFCTYSLFIQCWVHPDETQKAILRAVSGLKFEKCGIFDRFCDREDGVFSQVSSLHLACREPLTQKAITSIATRFPGLKTLRVDSAYIPKEVSDMLQTSQTIRTFIMPVADFPQFSLKDRCIIWKNASRSEPEIHLEHRDATLFVELPSDERDFHMLHLEPTTTEQKNLVTDEVIAAIADLTKYLIGVKLIGCTKITDRALKALCKNCADQSHVLNGELVFMPNGEPRILRHKAYREQFAVPIGSALDRINLSGCVNVTDEAVGYLLLHGKHLVREINLSGCTRLTNAVLDTIATLQSTCFTQLDLSGCTQITYDENDSRRIFLNCKSLTNVRLPNGKFHVHEGCLILERFDRLSLQ